MKRNPLSLYLEGSRDSVKRAEEYIDRIQKVDWVHRLTLMPYTYNWQSIVEDTFDTPSKHPVPQEALHSISRLSGAFVEQTGVQEVRVSLSLVDNIFTLPFKLRVRAKHPSNIMLAKRLAIRANYQVCTSSLIQDSLLTLLWQVEPSELVAQQIHHNEFLTPTAAPLAYSLYPFSGPRSLPTMTRSSTFLRWRRVGDWLGDSHSQSLDTSGLAHSQGSFSSIDGCVYSPCGL